MQPGDFEQPYPLRMPRAHHWLNRVMNVMPSHIDVETPDLPSSSRTRRQVRPRRPSAAREIRRPAQECVDDAHDQILTAACCLAGVRSPLAHL